MSTEVQCVDDELSVSLDAESNIKPLGINFENGVDLPQSEAELFLRLEIGSP